MLTAYQEQCLQKGKPQAEQMVSVLSTQYFYLQIQALLHMQGRPYQLHMYTASSYLLQSCIGNAAWWHVVLFCSGRGSSRYQAKTFPSRLLGCFRQYLNTAAQFQDEQSLPAPSRYYQPSHSHLFVGDAVYPVTQSEVRKRKGEGFKSIRDVGCMLCVCMWFPRVFLACSYLFP